MAQIALVTGASSGFGSMIAGDLAAAGLIAYASMRDTGGKNAGTVKEIADQAKDKGVHHCPNAGHPKHEDRAKAYEAGWPTGFSDRMQKALAATDPPDSDPSEIGRVVAAIATTPVGKRPFRTVIDPADDGAKVTFPVADRIREQFLHRIGFPELLHPVIRSQ